MRRYLSRILLIVGLSLGFTSTTIAQLQCDKPVAEAGAVKCGAALVHRFLLINTGTETITLTGLTPSCGCLAPSADRSVLKAGQESELTLEVNTLTQASGPQTWHARVQYRCGTETRELKLTLNARIETEILVTPAALNISTSSALSHEIIVTDLRDKPFAITGASVASPYIHITPGHPRRNADGKLTWLVTVDVQSGLAEGRHEDRILIETDDPTYPRLVVPLRIEKRARTHVRVVPEEMIFQRVTGSPQSRLLLLRPIDDQEIEVTKLNCFEPGIRAEWSRGPGGLVSIKVTIETTARKEGESTLTVELAKPVAQTLTIPVRWTMP